MSQILTRWVQWAIIGAPSTYINVDKPHHALTLRCKNLRNFDIQELLLEKPAYWIPTYTPIVWEQWLLPTSSAVCALTAQW